MKKLLTALFAIALSATAAMAANKYDNPDTIVVARDGTGEFRNISEAIEVCRAFMDYHKVIYVKRGGEDALTTIITWDDHANIMMPSAYDPIAIERHPTADNQHPTPSNYHPIGTFRTFTLRVCGSDITLKNITIENNSARLGQAVALHTEGDRLRFIGCRSIAMGSYADGIMMLA